MEESRGVQLLREWACAHSGDMACIDSISCILGESVRRSSQLPRPCGDYQEIAGWVSLWLSGAVYRPNSTKDVGVLNGLPKTRLRTCYRSTQRKGHQSSKTYLKLS